MLNKEIIIQGFNKCKEPVDFSRKYVYFKIKHPMKSVSDVKDTLICIEEVNLLGALYIAFLKEETIAKEYASDFLNRNKEIIYTGIHTDNEEAAYYMQMLYICLMLEDDEKRKETISEVFSKNILHKISETGNYDINSVKAASEHFANVLVFAVGSFDKEIPFTAKYCKIVTEIYHTRYEDTRFLHKVEAGLRKIKFGYTMDDDVAREYFNLLCNKKMYNDARCFLENFDGSKGMLGYRLSEFAKILFKIPDPGLLTTAKWCVKKEQNGEYSYKEWHDDVLSLNNDKECRKWIKLTLYYNELKELAQTEAWNEFYERLDAADSYEMFDMGKIRYMRQMVESFAYICNMLIKNSDGRVITFLRKMNHVNINSFERTKNLRFWNQNESIKEGYDYYEIERILFDEYDIEDTVFIYMNSHLKSVIALEHFVKNCAKIVGEDVSELFDNYRIVGKMSQGFILNSVRDKLFMCPLGFESYVSYEEFDRIGKYYGHRTEEAQQYYKQMIRSSEEWYALNKETAELIKTGDICRALISKCKKNAGILVSDIELDNDEREQRIEERNTIYPEKIIEWLKGIQAEKLFEKWDQRESVYCVNHIESIEKRIEIAIEILNTVIALKDNVNELEAFIVAVSNPPIKNMNEARYIVTQRSLKIDIPNDMRMDVVNTVNNVAKIILTNDSIPKSIRKGVYLNTIIKKYYELREVCRQLGSELYEGIAEDPIVMALKFEKKQGEKYYFSTKRYNTVFYSKNKFVYEGELIDELEPSLVYLCTIKCYDDKKGYFIISRADLKNNEAAQWDIFLRKIRDIQKITDDSEVEKLKEEINEFNLVITSEKRISQLAHELDIIFENKKCSIDSAIKVISSIGEANPFIKQENSYSALSDEFEGAYLLRYESFLQDYQLSNDIGFCDLYFKSYLRVFIDFDTFVEDISNDVNTSDVILNYCRLKEYIK